jgi:hypothetical protein
MGFLDQAFATVSRSISGSVQSYTSRLISTGAQKLASSATRSMGGSIGSIANPLIYNAINSGVVMTDQLLSNSLNSFLNGTINYPYAQQIRMTPGLSNQTGRYVFGTPEQSTSLTYSPVEYSGYNPDVVGAVAPEYLIMIRNTKNWFIKAVMQESFFMGANSSWTPLVPMSVAHLINYASQFLTGKAIVAKWATRRVWTGTSPISLRVNLVFNAVNNEYIEVVRPCMRLQQMALPFMTGVSSNPVSSVIPLMNPPGPSPFNQSDDQTIIAQGANAIAGAREIFVGQGDRIDISIGKFLTFSNVVLKDVGVEYSAKMSQSGFPISSKATMIFETYEMITREDLENIHVKKG